MKYETQTIHRKQITAVLQQAEMGVEIKDLCSKFGFTDVTFYRWKKQYAGMGVSELQELRQARDENTKLKRIVADLTLDKQMLQELLKKCFKAPSQAHCG